MGGYFNGPRKAKLGQFSGDGEERVDLKAAMFVDLSKLRSHEAGECYQEFRVTSLPGLSLSKQSILISG